MTPLLHDGPRDAAITLVLAHGAGAAMDSPFMDDVARGVGARGIHVVRFEFPYMHARRSGKRPAPDRMPVLEATYREVVASLGGGSILVGGKSMGGRVAAHVADEVGARGVVCLGYPFHPAGKPDSLRVEAIHKLKTRACIVQGTRDALGNRDEVESYALPKRIEVHFVEDGDHSLAPRKSSGRSVKEALAEAIDHVATFAARVGA